ncbi:ABC transporter permease [Candidatus Gracilibacteria bacterium]|nr:ABC transporter permease [Candidatus Gracilibacteria bacterium]
MDAIEFRGKNIDPDDFGYIELNVFIDDFTNLQSVIDYFKDKNYLVISTGEILANSIKTSFTVISIVLGIFAAIALFASVFGIVNVMIISVLERQKEIGILKALGARSNDIFNIFLFESIFLGVLGWLFGWLLTLIVTKILSTAFDRLLLTNNSIQANLESFNITSFDLPIPLFILIITFFLAVIFTLLSGLYPAIQAARQNPVDTLRSE